MEHSGFLGLTVVISLYLLPAIIAWLRSHHNTMAITVLTLLLGWTILGWIAAIVWSCTEVHTPAHVEG